MRKASGAYLLEQTRFALRCAGVWPVVVIALVGPYLFWLLLRP